MPEAATGPAFVATLVDFGRQLRAAGVAVGSGDVLTYCAATAELNPADLLDLYWAGRTTLAHQRDDLATYDRVFREFFLGEPAEADERRPFSVAAREEATAVLQLPETEPPHGSPDPQEREARLGLLASDAATLKRKAFATCTPEELAQLRRILRSMRLRPPRRPGRRTMPARAGRRPDLRRTVRETLRTHAEPGRLYWRDRRLRQRPLTLILDVSGSMADYSRNLLQFAHSTARGARRVEVFCFGTRLTRITPQLAHRRPDEAMDRAARSVVDWDGGTRIGAALDTFVRDWGRRGLCRGGIVVVCSDGLDRGDPALLAAAIERLSRLCHRIVWLNPHKGDDPDFRPSTLGMMVAAPYVDVLLSGHDLRSLEQLARLLPTLG